MAQESTEDRELSLVGKVELRIAMAASDVKFETILNTYLPPMLLKLASDSAKVRNKVISVCQHINQRTKSPAIKLPVAALLQQFKGNPNPVIRHFDLLYIHQSVDRLSKDERLELLPLILHGFKSNFAESTASAASIFNLLLRLLHLVVWPARGSKDDVDLRTTLKLSEDPKNAEFVASWLGKLMLFSTKHSAGSSSAGLKKLEVNFFQLNGKQSAWEGAVEGGLNLAETKYVVSRFLASGTFIDSERYIPALIMSTQVDSRLSDTGEDILKRAATSVSLEDVEFLRELYGMYLGTRGVDGSLPAPVPLQTKILSLLCRSKAASSFINESTQIIEETLTSENQSQVDGPVINKKEGLEASKLRQQVFAFTNWLARISPASEISQFAPRLASQLQNYVEGQGWPRPREHPPLTDGEISSRSYGYESIGLLASASPVRLLLDPDLYILRWLLTSLSQDSSTNDVSLSIEQALSNILGAFGGRLDPALEDSLTSLFLHHMSLRPDSPESSEGVVRNTCFMAVRFANRCLPYNRVEARWINILAIQRGVETGRSELVDEGRKGLDPHWYRLLNPAKSSVGDDDTAFKYKFPGSAALNTLLLGPTSGWEPAILRNPPLAESYVSALAYCRNILVYEVLVAIKQAPLIDANWEQRMETLVTSDESIRFKLSHEIRQILHLDQGYSQSMQRFLHACFTGVVFLSSKEACRAGDFLIETCSFISSDVYINLRDRLDTIQQSILSSDAALQERSAHIFGIVGSLSPEVTSSSRTMLDKFMAISSGWSTAVGQSAVEVRGSILAASHLFSKFQWRSKFPDDLNATLSRWLIRLLDILFETRDAALIDAIFKSFSQMALSGLLLPDRIPAPRTLKEIIGILVEKSKGGNETAITALGHLAIQLPEQETTDTTDTMEVTGTALATVIASLHELHDVRQAEIQFAVGAALACAATGWQSKSLVSVDEIPGLKPHSAPRSKTLTRILETVLVDCKTTKPALRQAAVIWLLCLVQYCGHLPELQSKLEDCQAAFKKFLADRDSINQESAARGLALVYEKGNRSLKDDLIKDLVHSFTGGASGMAGTVSSDTELFEAGALPTGDGSITTYKDILSLAAEVGDSSLVYRFMSLASNNAIWSSRAAFGRFGLSSILSEASTDGLLAQNPKLYPALFRYRFDPNTNVRTAMNDIWTALVKEPSATINRHFDVIMQDLLKNILGKEWRARQASCAAIADLIQGRKFETYETYLSDIWTCTFKVCDDIKESVRAAAMSLARVLTGILTRELESDHAESKQVAKMLDKILPFLLSPSGLESSAPDVQGFARKALLDIIRKANKRSLRPFVPELVGKLLALLSSVEPEMINYIHLNAEKYGITADELDDARLKFIKGSAMLESIERCLDFLDEQCMLQLKPFLENAIRSVIGLPSKVGCSRVLVSLATRHSFIFKPYADHFLTIARKQVFDRNDTISSSYAVACGYIARLASEKTLLDFLKICQTTYFSSDDERSRWITGEIIYAMSKHATDRFNSVASAAVPFVFVAKHDTDDRAKAPFKACWDENTGGSRTVLLYLTEILQIAVQNLESARWSIKHTCAFAIGDVVSSCGTSIGEATARSIWPALEKALSGKTWEGKEELVKAGVLLTKHSKLLEQDQGIRQQLTKIMFRESKRNNLLYQKEAIKSLGQYLEIQKGIDMYDETADVVESLIENASENSQNAMDIDSGAKGSSSSNLTEAAVVNAIVTMFKAINPSCRPDETLAIALKRSLSTWKMAEQKEIAGRSLRAGVLHQLIVLFGDLSAMDGKRWSESLLDTLGQYASELLGVADEIEQIRKEAAEAAISFAGIARVQERQSLRDTFVEGLIRSRKQERSPSVKQSLERAIHILQKNN